MKRPLGIEEALLSSKPERRSKLEFQWTDSCFSTLLDGYSDFAVELYGLPRWQLHDRMRIIASALSDESIRSRIPEEPVVPIGYSNVQFDGRKSVSRLRYRVICNRCRNRFSSLVPGRCPNCDNEVTEGDLATAEKIASLGITWKNLEEKNETIENQNPIFSLRGEISGYESEVKRLLDLWKYKYIHPREFKEIIQDENGNWRSYTADFLLTPENIVIEPHYYDSSDPHFVEKMRAFRLKHSNMPVILVTQERHLPEEICDRRVDWNDPQGLLDAIKDLSNKQS